MAPVLREVQRTSKIYGDLDMGSKRYTMEPSVTVNVHWGENKNGVMRIRSLCLGNHPFQLPKELKLSQEMLNKISEDCEEEDDTEESSTWGDIEEV
jgi:hypothetical protein